MKKQYVVIVVIIIIMMAVLLGVYKIWNTIGFDQNWETLSNGYYYGDLNELIDNTDDVFYKEEQLNHYLRNNDVNKKNNLIN